MGLDAHESAGRWFNGPENVQNIRAVPTQVALGPAGQLHRAMRAPGLSGIPAPPTFERGL